MPNGLVSNKSFERLHFKQESQDGLPISTCLIGLLGTEVTVFCVEQREKVEYEGILINCSSIFDIILKKVRRRVFGDDNNIISETNLSSVTLQSSVVASIRGNMDSIKKANECDRLKGFVTDAEISSVKATKIADEKSFDDLQKWSDGEENELLVETSNAEVQQGNARNLKGLNKEASGWSVDEMFDANKELGVTTSFNQDLSQYTTVEVVGTAEQRQRANELASQIERNKESQRNAMLENDDEERNLNEKTSFILVSKNTNNNYKNDRDYRDAKYSSATNRRREMEQKTSWRTSAPSRTIHSMTQGTTSLTSSLKTNTSRLTANNNAQNVSNSNLLSNRIAVSLQSSSNVSHVTKISLKNVSSSSPTITTTTPVNNVVSNNVSTNAQTVTQNHVNTPSSKPSLLCMTSSETKIESLTTVNQKPLSSQSPISNSLTSSVPLTKNVSLRNEQQTSKPSSDSLIESGNTEHTTLNSAQQTSVATTSLTNSKSLKEKFPSFKFNPDARPFVPKDPSTKSTESNKITSPNNNASTVNHLNVSGTVLSPPYVAPVVASPAISPSNQPVLVMSSPGITGAAPTVQFLPIQVPPPNVVYNTMWRCPTPSGAAVQPQTVMLGKSGQVLISTGHSSQDAMQQQRIPGQSIQAHMSVQYNQQQQQSNRIQSNYGNIAPISSTNQYAHQSLDQRLSIGHPPPYGQQIFAATSQQFSSTSGYEVPAIMYNAQAAALVQQSQQANFRGSVENDLQHQQTQSQYYALQTPTTAITAQYPYIINNNLVNNPIPYQTISASAHPTRSQNMEVAMSNISAVPPPSFVASFIPHTSLQPIVHVGHVSNAFGHPVPVIYQQTPPGQLSIQQQSLQQQSQQRQS